MQRKRLWVASLAAISLIALAGCGASSVAPPQETAGADEPYRVLVLGGIGAEGVLANNSATSVLSAQASAEVINANGGILGREIEVTVADDQGDPTRAVTVVREALASEDKPDVVLNSGPSTIAEATLPLISQAGILSFNIGPTATSADPSVVPYNFDLAPSVGSHVAGFQTEIDAKGYEKVAVLHGSSSYGESFGKLAEEQFTKAGISVTGNQVYDVAALDMTAQLEALKATDPEALILDAYGAPLGYILQGVEKLGWDIPIIGNLSVAATSLVSTEPPSGLLGTNQVKNLTMQAFASTVYDANATQTNEAVATMMKLGDIKATMIMAYNYDALILVKTAAEAIDDSSDPKAIAKALEDPAITANAKTAILSTYAFSEKQHAPAADGKEFTFIPPSSVRDGQYHPEG